MCHSQKEMVEYMYDYNLSPWELFWVEGQSCLHSERKILKTPPLLGKKKIVYILPK